MSHPTVSKTDAQGVFAPAATNESEVASLTPNHGHNARDLPPERPRYLPLGHSPPKLVIHPYSGLESETTRTHDSLDLSSDEADTCMPDRLDRDESEDDVRSSTLSQLSRTSLHLETGPKYKVFGTTTGVSLNRRVGNASSDDSRGVLKLPQAGQALFRASVRTGLNPADYAQGDAPRRTTPTVISDAGIQQFKGQRHGNASPGATSAEPHATLEDRLFATRQITQHPQAEPWKKDMGFIPKKQLDNIITEESVYLELMEHFAHSFDEAKFKEYAAYICRDEKVIVRDGRVKLKSYKPVFALLVMFNKTSEILDILGEDVSDLDLPLVEIVEGSYGRHRIGRRSRVHKIHSPDTNVHLWCFSKWSRVESESFLRYQWMMLAPFFRESEYNDVQHYELHDSHILPWIDRADDEYFEHQGGFGTVFPVHIHPEHHNFGDSEACKRGFAIKQLMHRNPVRFKREVEILQKFVGNNAHPHIVSLLATYEHCGKYHMIFYRAQGDLFTYWKTVNPRPSFSSTTVLWVARQCEGIADGLVQLHRHRTLPKSAEDDGESLVQSIYPQRSNAQSRETIQPTTASKSQNLLGKSNLGKRKRPVDDTGVEQELREREGEWQFGRHGDLKPENILWFEGSEGAPGTLKIADFGQAELHEWQCKTRKRSEDADTMAYRAPECHFEEGKFRQSSDVWSLGCLLLVFVTWTLGGAELVNEFAQVRSAFDEYWGMPSDTFFQSRSLQEPDTYSVTVKPAVVQFIRELHSHRNCSAYFHDLLDLIYKKMLVVEMASENRRLPCHQVFKRLSEMHEKCHAKKGYATTPMPWKSHDETMPEPSSPIHVRPLMVAKGDMELIIKTKRAQVGVTGLRDHRRPLGAKGCRRTRTN